MIEYYVSTKQSKAHIFDIKLVIAKPDTQRQKISLASWTPGSYLIRDFARHIVTIKTDGADLFKINNNTWEIKSISSPLIVEYQVYAFDMSVREAYLDDEQGFINGSCLFMKVHGQERAPHQVSLLLDNPTWQIATTLSSHQTSIDENCFQANSYDELIDHPIQMGSFEKHDFDVLGIPHSLVITGQHDGNIPQLIADIEMICKNQLRLFGDPAPFERYLFLLSVRKEAYGGLEHRSSTALQIQRDYMPVKGVNEKTPGYIALLALISHEYFHSWNVKKIKPLCFEPYDLDKKACTSQLWAFEGITSYYDELILVRAKVITLEQYFDLLSQNITKLLRNPGREKQTLIDSSYDAWIKFYQPNDNSPNASVSYYLKGSVAALAFDLFLRASGNTLSLDNVMLALWEKYGKTEIGVPEGAIEILIAELGGEKIVPLIQQALHSTEDIALKALFSPFGVELSLRESLGSDDLGGKRECPKDLAFQPGTLQCTFNRVNSKIFIATVYDNGAGQKAGLSPQDELIAINGLRVDADSFEKMLKRYPVGAMVELTLFRQDILKFKKITLQAPNKDTAQLTIKEHLSQEEKNNLNKWLFNEPNSGGS